MKWVKASERLPEKIEDVTKNSYSVKCYNRKDAIYWCDNNWQWIGTSYKLSERDFNTLEWLDEASPEQGKDEVYWKQRCEAAELIIGISGVVDCEGYEQWERIKESEASQPIASPSIAVEENKEEVNKLLIDSNELIRSFYSIAARYGKDTNWDAFLRKVEGVLNEQHKILYPHGNEIEKI